MNDWSSRWQDAPPDIRRLVLAGSDKAGVSAQEFVYASIRAHFDTLMNDATPVRMAATAEPIEVTWQERRPINMAHDADRNREIASVPPMSRGATELTQRVKQANARHAHAARPGGHLGAAGAEPDGPDRGDDAPEATLPVKRGPGRPRKNPAKPKPEPMTPPPGCGWMNISTPDVEFYGRLIELLAPEEPDLLLEFGELREFVDYRGTQGAQSKGTIALYHRVAWYVTHVKNDNGKASAYVRDLLAMARQKYADAITDRTEGKYAAGV